MVHVQHCSVTRLRIARTLPLKLNPLFSRLIPSVYFYLAPSGRENQRPCFSSSLRSLFNELGNLCLAQFHFVANILYVAQNRVQTAIRNFLLKFVSVEHNNKQFLIMSTGSFSDSERGQNLKRFRSVALLLSQPLTCPIPIYFRLVLLFSPS